MLRFSLAVLAVGLGTSAQAQSAGPLADARARLAAGDSAAAYQTVCRAALDGADDPAVLRLRLQLEVAGAGRGTESMEARRQTLRWSGQALRDRAPADTLALRVLTDEAIWRVLDNHDRVRPAQIRGEFTELLSQREEDARLRRSRFDTAMRQRIAPDDDLSFRAREAHEQALETTAAWLAAAPGAARAYDGLATLAAVTQNADALAEVARQFGTATRSPRADLYLGLASFLQGDDTAAWAAFDRAIARMPAEERARFHDVRVLLRTDQQAEYQANPDSVAAAFWAATDSRRLTPVHERRVEHVARVVEADLLFGRYGWHDAFSTASPRGAETQRGRLWVRYGRPLLTNTLDARPGGVSFYGDSGFVVWEYPDRRYVLSRAGDDYQTYAPPAEAYTSSRFGNAAFNDDYVIQDRVLRRDEPQRTLDLPAVALDVPVLVSRFRQPGGGTEAVVAVGIPSNVRDPARVGVYALQGEAVTASVERQRPPDRTDAATLRLAGASQVRIEVEAPGDARGAAEVPVEPLADGFGVSDLLLAYATDEEGRGAVVRDGLGIVPAAQASFPTTDPVYVVLEAYGLGLDDGRTRYTVQATLTPAARRGGLVGRVLGRGQDPGVAVRTEAGGRQPDELVSFFVDVRDQPPGRYTLRVEVADDVSGQSASAERQIVLE